MPADAFALAVRPAPQVRMFELRNVTSRRSRYAPPVCGVRLIDCRSVNVADDNLIEHVEEIEFQNVAINRRLVRDLRAA